MAKEKSIVEEAILSMKNLEEAVAENAKGILASTMKEEIKELVKESLTEDEEETDDEIEPTDVDMDADDSEEGDEPEDEEMDDMDTDNMDIDTDNEETIDLTGESDDDVLRVFKLMGPEDSIVVTKDEAGNINLKDEDKEYMIVGESEMDQFNSETEMFEFEDDDDQYDLGKIEDTIDSIFGESDHDKNEENEEVVYEIEMGPEEDVEFSDIELGEMYHSDDKDEENEEVVYEIEMNSDDDLYGDAFVDENEMYGSNEENEEVVYEIEVDSDDETEFYGDDDYDMGLGETFDDEDELKPLGESKKSFKAKGLGLGNPSKFKYGKKPNMSGGFSEKMKQGPRSVGTGKAKFEYKNGENAGSNLGKNKIVKKKVETKEASRTLGSGKDFRKGGLPKRRAHSAFNINIEENFSGRDIEILREKNEEYRKALNVFRNKLNEVAVFNSNLAYATRLFTEHSTSKQEKINILRRFDSVETIKESKNLYKTIKDELSSSSSKGKSITESVERQIDKSVSSGSAANLIESKTYENPQFLRMKDLMSKLTK